MPLRRPQACPDRLLQTKDVVRFEDEVALKMKSEVSSILDAKSCQADLAPRER